MRGVVVGKAYSPEEFRAKLLLHGLGEREIEFIFKPLKLILLSCVVD